MVSDAAYRPRRPEESLLYQVVAGELETFLASQQDNEILLGEAGLVDDGFGCATFEVAERAEEIFQNYRRPRR